MWAFGFMLDAGRVRQEVGGTGQRSEGGEGEKWFIRGCDI